MTLQDLNRYLSLCKQLDKARESLLDLQDAAVPGAQVLTGMPHTPGVKDKVGNLAIEIADTKDEIAKMEREIEALADDVDTFIKTIPYVELRTIFRLRYFRFLSWEDIAEVFRWRLSESTLRRRVERYMAKIESGDSPDVQE